MTDTEYFNEAFMAFCWRETYDGRFCELTIPQQMEVLRDAQTLKDAGRIAGEAVKSYAAQPLPHEVGLCCMRDHANAVAPWTCQCECHKR